MKTRVRARRLAGGLLAGALAVSMSLLFLPQAALAAGGGNVYFKWRIPGAPAEGLPDITFVQRIDPVSMHARGTFVSNEFQFRGITSLGYIGLQPRPDAGGVGRLQAVFSSFSAEARPADPRCNGGADGGAGVSCAVQFDAVYGRDYRLTVSTIGEDLWVGTVTDSVTGAVTEIGRYTLPERAGLLRPSHTGFVENYRTVNGCTDIERIGAVLGRPSSSIGLIGETYGVGATDAGVCAGQAGYSSTTADGTITVNRGNKQPALDVAPTMSVVDDELSITVGSALASGAYRLVIVADGRIIMESYGGSSTVGTRKVDGAKTTLVVGVPGLPSGAAVSVLLAPGVPGEDSTGAVELGSWTYVRAPGDGDPGDEEPGGGDPGEGPGGDPGTGPGGGDPGDDGPGVEEPGAAPGGAVPDSGRPSRTPHPPMGRADADADALAATGGAGQDVLLPAGGILLLAGAVSIVLGARRRARTRSSRGRSSSAEA